MVKLVKDDYIIYFAFLMQLGDFEHIFLASNYHASYGHMLFFLCPFGLTLVKIGQD
jgi:hypothetical protein